MTTARPLWGAPWRTGRHVGRTIYAVVGDEASREDILIGVMDTPKLAEVVVEAHNIDARLQERDREHNLETFADDPPPGPPR